jgi:hypothetical protein
MYDIDKLNMAIMNIPSVPDESKCPKYSKEYHAYKLGHRDARHAAVEIMLEHFKDVSERAAPEAPADQITYTVDGIVISQLEYIDYLHKRIASTAQQAGAAERARELVEQYRTGYRHGYEEGRAEPPVATTASASEELRQTVKPMPLQYPLDDYWNAPSGVGPLATRYNNKPHQLMYELIAALLCAPAPSRDAAPLDPLSPDYVKPWAQRLFNPGNRNIQTAMEAEIADLRAALLGKGTHGTPVTNSHASNAGEDTELRKRVLEAWANYERMGEVCSFEGNPMICASTLEEIAAIAASAEQEKKK